MSYTTWLALAILALLFYVCYRKINEAGKTLPPSPKGLPLIGHFFQLFPFNLMKLTQIADDLGGVYMMHIFNVHIVFLNSAAAVKEALVNQSDTFAAKKIPRERWVQELCRYAFLFLDGPVLREKRRFTLHHMRNFGFGKSAMETIITNEFTRMSAILDQHDGKKTCLKNICFTTILNVVWGVIAGKTYEHDGSLDDISEAIHGVFHYGIINSLQGVLPGLRYIPGDPFNAKKVTDCVHTVYAFIQVEIEEHWKMLNDGEPRDYIDAYLKEIKKREGTILTGGNECFTERHLLNGVTDLLNAGVETTSGTIEWSLLYMSVWPDIQDKVQAELDTVIGRNRRPKYSDIPMLPYTKATIMEIQRFASMVTCCSPRLISKTTTLMNYTIPKGTLAIQNLYAVHRDRKAWGDPEVFRPERFINDQMKAETPDHFIPFTIGPRSCAGESLARMEIFLLFTSLMQRYTFRCVTGEPTPSIEPMIGMTNVSRPHHLVVKLRPFSSIATDERRA